jgi:hypothetical protein
MANINVNIDEGFLIHWCTHFMEYYGNESLFVHALSDFHTLKIAHMLHDRGQINDFSTVKLYVDEEPLEAIRHLSRISQAVRKPLFQEPLGSAPIGAIECSVNSEFGEGAFSCWLNAFENREFEKCKETLIRQH